MAADNRLTAVSNFTPTKHHSIPDMLNLNLVTLPSDFTICIIGAGQGIGEQIAYAYAHAKASNIIISARSVTDLERVSQRIKSINDTINIVHSHCDISSVISVSELSALTKRKFNRLDVLVCNAGYAGPVTLKVHEGEPEWVQQAFDVNMMGTYHAAHYFIPLLLSSQDGAKSFFAIGSLASIIRRGTIANTGYVISKMAQTRLIEMLAEQYSDQGLFPATIHPGAVMTNMARGNTPEDFLPYLVNDAALCGATCVWLSNNVEDLKWLGGRFISANWDMDEICKEKERIIERDLLKLTMLAD